MKTTLGGVVFLLPHVSGHAKKRSFTAGGFSPDRGKGEETACAVRASRPDGGVASGGRQGSGRQGDRAAGGKAAGRQGSGRQGGRAARWQGGRAARWQGGRAAGRRSAGRQAARQQGSGRKGDRAAVGRAAGRRAAGRQKKRGLRFFLKKKLKTILSENHMSPHPGGKAASSQRTSPERRPHTPKKTGETIMSRPF